MFTYTPYTYLIGWSKHDRWYYGVRYKQNCHPSDLWVTYFTSSRHVKRFRDMHGEPDVVEVRRRFPNADQALSWERKVLKRLDVAHDPKWINVSDGQNNYWMRKPSEDNLGWGINDMPFKYREEKMMAVIDEYDPEEIEDLFVTKNYHEGPFTNRDFAGKI